MSDNKCSIKFCQVCLVDNYKYMKTNSLTWENNLFSPYFQGHGPICYFNFE